MPSPECLIIAGPNGGGKTTVYRHLLAQGQFPAALDYVNTDELLRELRLHAPAASEIAAGRLSLIRINNLIDRRESFVFETTLSSQHSLRVMRRLRQSGYHVGLIFVLLQNVELHIARVATRVALGGHFVAERDIRRRYISALENMCRALDLFDEGYVVDNSPANSPRRLLSISSGRIGRLEGFDGRSEFDLMLWHKLLAWESPC